MHQSVTDAMLESAEIAQAVNAVLDDHPEHGRQSKFFALLALASEQAIRMEADTPGIFDEHGGRKKWVHAMLDKALEEIAFGLSQVGKPKN